MLVVVALRKGILNKSPIIGDILSGLEVLWGHVDQGLLLVMSLVDVMMEVSVETWWGGWSGRRGLRLTEDIAGEPRK